MPVAPTGAFAAPMPTGFDRSPYLGTFRPDPTLVVTTNYAGGHGYTPLGNPSGAAAMSLYGPFSRLRSRPSEAVFYSRGYDGRPIPTASGVIYSYPDPRLYPDTTLVPTALEIRRLRGMTRRSMMAPYLLGQY